MRRKFVNSKSLIFIVLIAIFTITSYVSDQGVIRQEDSLRKSDIKIDNLNSQLYDVKTINKQFISLQDFITENLIEFNRNQLFWFKSLILVEKNSKNIDKDMDKALMDYDFTIESIKNRFNYHYEQIVYKSLEIVDRFEDVHTWNEIYFKEYFDNEGYYIGEKLNYDFGVIFKSNIDSFNVKDFGRYYPPSITKAINEYTILNFLDIYTFSYFLLNNMENYYKVISEENIRIEKLNLDYTEQLYNELSINKHISSLKNYLVLMSIISQILSLFFLLLFFRNLLINKI